MHDTVEEGQGWVPGHPPKVPGWSVNQKKVDRVEPCQSDAVVPWELLSSQLDVLEWGMSDID